MERTIRVCADFAEAEKVDIDQWLELSGDERVRIGEQMRREAWEPDEQGLRRVLRVAEHPRG
jgi:hypothetical protein